MAEKRRVRAPVPPPSSPRFLPGLFLLFVGSGCAALIYEVVWFQLLELVIGATALSLGVLLATFMGGMCAGGLLLPRLVDDTANFGAEYNGNGRSSAFRQPTGFIPGIGYPRQAQLGARFLF